MIKIPQTLKSLTLCTTLAIAVSVNGTHPAQAAGVPLEDNKTGAVTYGGTFSNYSVPQKWTFSEGTSNITTPPIIAIKGQSTYTFPTQDPKILVTGTLLPNLYRNIPGIQRDIVPSYTIEALNSRGERVTAKINNEHQTITLPITKAGELNNYVGELTLGVAESRIIAVDFLRYDGYNKTLSALIPTTVVIYDDMRGTAGPSAVGCAFPSTGGGPAGYNPNASLPVAASDLTGSNYRTNSGTLGYPAMIRADLVYTSSQNATLSVLQDGLTVTYPDRVSYTTSYPNGPEHEYISTLMDYGETDGLYSVISINSRTSCETPSSYSAMLSSISLNAFGLGGDFPLLASTLGSNVLEAMDNLARGRNIGILGSLTFEIHARGAMSIVASPESVTYKNGQEPVDWTATLTIVVAPL